MLPKLILLMRHAEKSGDPADPDISDAGAARAEKLVSWVPQSFGRLDFLIASSISRHSARPFETIEPLSKALGLPIDATFADQDYPALADELLTHQGYQGASVLVCWHHGNIPSLARHLNAEAGSYPDPWNPGVFNLTIRLDYIGAGKPKVTQVIEPF